MGLLDFLFGSDKKKEPVQKSVQKPPNKPLQRKPVFERNKRKLSDGQKTKPLSQTNFGRSSGLNPDEKTVRFTPKKQTKSSSNEPERSRVLEETPGGSATPNAQKTSPVTVGHTRQTLVSGLSTRKDSEKISAVQIQIKKESEQFVRNVLPKIKELLEEAYVSLHYYHRLYKKEVFSDYASQFYPVHFASSLDVLMREVEKLINATAYGTVMLPLKENFILYACIKKDMILSILLDAQKTNIGFLDAVFKPAMQDFVRK